jgi:uroporphyrinogen-III synthase
VVVATYETVAAPLDDDVRTAALGADDVTFASGSAARHFLQAAGGSLPNDGPRVVSIGPQTSEALREFGVQPDVEAEVHTPDGLVDALLRDTR